MTQTSNPLRQYFRQPVIYLKLPSNGNFWPPGSIDMPPSGELPVLPMTAIDEITYRTPDALYNGQSTVSVIESCMPHILNAWNMPVMDFDSILVAIRIASYGHELEINSVCVNCSNDEQFTVDLREVMDKLRAPNYNQPLQIADLEIHFKPLTYQQSSDNSIKQFEEQKLLTVIGESNLSEEEKLQRFSQAMSQITEMTMATLANCVSMIKTPNSLVSETQYILEFLKECDRQTFNAIRDHVINLRKETDIKPLTIQCPKCQHQ